MVTENRRMMAVLVVITVAAFNMGRFMAPNLPSDTAPNLLSHVAPNLPSMAPNLPSQAAHLPDTSSVPPSVAWSAPSGTPSSIASSADGSTFDVQGKTLKVGPVFNLAEVEHCVLTDATDPSILPQDPKEARHGNSWGGGAAGRFTYCLMRQEVMATVCTYFAGYPGMGAPFLMASANKWKAEHALQWKPVQAPEGNKGYYDGLVAMYERKQISQYINLMHKFVQPEDAAELCPEGQLDLWETDISCATPSPVWMTFFRTCFPKYWLMGESGMECACGAGCDQWHDTENFVHDYGFLPFEPHLKYEKVVDRRPSGLFGVEGRKFTFYRLVGHQDVVPAHLARRAAALSKHFDPCGSTPTPTRNPRPEFCGPVSTEPH